MVPLGRFLSWVAVLAGGTIIFASCAPDLELNSPPVKLTQSGTGNQAITPAREESQPTNEPIQTAVPSPTLTAQPRNQDEEASSKANANVLFVLARQESENTWHFSVTVEHPDTGWEDYADGWDVVLPDGSIAKPDQDSPFTRLLLHPHETEQPFTRSQGGIVIAPGITEVTVRAHDLVDGFGGREVIVNLLSEDGPDYEVQHLAEK